MSSNNVLDVSKKENSSKKLENNTGNANNDNANNDNANTGDANTGDANTGNANNDNATDALDETMEPDIDYLFSDLLLSMHKFKQEFSNLQTKMKNLEKICKKEKRKYNKIAGKQNKGNKAPSGFAKPTTISEELCSFMNLEPGTKVARTEVTQFITKYIKDNNLQKISDKRYIIPNEALHKLWNTKDDDEVTFFTIQSHMNRHYI